MRRLLIFITLILFEFFNLSLSKTQLEILIKKEPYNYSAKNQLALIYIKERKYDKALKLLKDCLSADNPVYNYNLFLLYIKLKKYREAILLYKSADFGKFTEKVSKVVEYIQRNENIVFNFPPDDFKKSWNWKVKARYFIDRGFFLEAYFLLMQNGYPKCWKRQIQLEKKMALYYLLGKKINIKNFFCPITKYKYNLENGYPYCKYCGNPVYFLTKVFWEYYYFFRFKKTVSRVKQIIESAIKRYKDDFWQLPNGIEELLRKGYLYRKDIISLYGGKWLILNGKVVYTLKLREPGEGALFNFGSVYNNLGYLSAILKYYNSKLDIESLIKQLLLYYKYFLLTKDEKLKKKLLNIIGNLLKNPKIEKYRFIVEVLYDYLKINK